MTKFKWVMILLLSFSLAIAEEEAEPRLTPGCELGTSWRYRDARAPADGGGARRRRRRDDDDGETRQLPPC